MHCILWRQEYVYRESSNYQDSSEQHYLHPNAIFSTADIKDFYLNTPLFTFEYMRLPINIIPEEIIEQYNLLPLVINGLVYIEIRKGVYGLPQAGKIAHDRLDKYLLQYGYTSTPRTPGLWRHSHRPIAFTFVVDDFGIKSEDVRHITHFINALRDLYTITAYPTSSLYYGMTLEWNYAKKYVDVSMPGYVTNTLHIFRHTTLSKLQYSPFKFIRLNYGSMVQYAPETNISQLLSASGKTCVQQIVGTFLYYARAIDNTIFPALDLLSASQSKPTASTNHDITQFLNYAATHPHATIRYNGSYTILHEHSDTSFLYEPNTKSHPTQLIHLLSSLNSVVHFTLNVTTPNHGFSG